MLISFIIWHTISVNEFFNKKNQYNKDVELSWCQYRADSATESSPFTPDMG